MRTMPCSSNTNAPPGKLASDRFSRGVGNPSRPPIRAFSPPKRRSTPSTARSVVLLTQIILAGCAGDLRETSTSPAPTPVRPAGTLEIRLQFGEQADLDLFVTDPDQETVYFGNNPSRTGGRLEGDVRCKAPAPRTEVVHYANPKPGRYRVGIEYNRSCVFRRKPADYRIDVRADGFERTLSTQIEPGRFEHKALEFSLDAVARP
jgi:hypothetical protein